MVICRNFDVRNRNAEICLENRYDSAKIGMVGISTAPICLLSSAYYFLIINLNHQLEDSFLEIQHLELISLPLECSVWGSTTTLL